jgi:hypothetical protein
MNWDVISAVSDVIATFAVVGSVAYLAIQIRQLNVLSHGESRAASALSAQQELFKIIDHPEIFEAFTKNQLTTTEKIRLNEWLIASLKQREYQWNQYRNGILDRETFESYSAVLPIILGTERTARWWEFSKGDAFGAEFARHVDGLLANRKRTRFFEAVLEWE